MSELTRLYLFHVHIFFSVLFFFGVGLLFSWLKTQPPERRRHWASLCIAIGALGTLLTIPFCLAGLRLLQG